MKILIGEGTFWNFARGKPPPGWKTLPQPELSFEFGIYHRGLTEYWFLFQSFHQNSSKNAHPSSLSFLSVFAVTAANTHESSYAAFYDSRRRAYLADEFSANWMHDTETVSIPFRDLSKFTGYLARASGKICRKKVFLSRCRWSRPNKFWSFQINFGWTSESPNIVILRNISMHTAPLHTPAFHIQIPGGP